MAPLKKHFTSNHSINNQFNPKEILKEYGRWIKGYMDQGYRMYLVTFTFKHIPGSNFTKQTEMMKQIEFQFYPTLIKHVERHPMKLHRQCNLPRLIALPDAPVPKKTQSGKMSLSDVTINNGRHVHAIIGMARTMRHPKGFKLTALIRDYSERFIGPFTTIANIDVKRMKTRPRFVTDYVLKHAKRDRSVLDHLLILPKLPKDVSPPELEELVVSHRPR